MRAESLFNVATEIDNLGVQNSYGDKSLHEQSHGEAFMTLVESRFSQGLYFLDEPEAALSPQRQLEFLPRREGRLAVAAYRAERPGRRRVHGMLREPRRLRGERSPERMARLVPRPPECANDFARGHL